MARLSTRRPRWSRREHRERRVAGPPGRPGDRPVRRAGARTRRSGRLRHPSGGRGTGSWGSRWCRSRGAGRRRGASAAVARPRRGPRGRGARRFAARESSWTSCPVRPFLAGPRNRADSVHPMGGRPAIDGAMATGWRRGAGSVALDARTLRRHRLNAPKDGAGPRTCQTRVLVGWLRGLGLPSRSSTRPRPGSSMQGSGPHHVPFGAGPGVHQQPGRRAERGRAAFLSWRRLGPAGAGWRPAGAGWRRLGPVGAGWSGMARPAHHRRPTSDARPACRPWDGPPATIW